jgi:hypothetical protein
LKIHDLISTTKYLPLVQKATKSGETVKLRKINQLSDTQKHLKNMLQHGFNTTNMNLDDIHIARRE